MAQNGEFTVNVAQVQNGEATFGIVVASKSHLNAEAAGFIDRLGASELVQAGNSQKFCRISEGAPDVYPRFGPTCELDTAAAQTAVEVAGGYMLTLDGMPFDTATGAVELVSRRIVLARAEAVLI